MHEPLRRVDLDDRAVGEQAVTCRGSHLQPRACLPVRADPCAEVVLGPDLRVGDRLPQALWGGADVDLEYLLHLSLHFLALVRDVHAVARCCGPSPWLED